MILVTGGQGQLAQCIKDRLSGAILADKNECDITDFSSLKEFIQRHSPEIVINCAAYTAVDKAEEEPEKAFLINETGAENLAILSESEGFDLIHISTDYVFDGKQNIPYKETDTCNPESIYGESKLRGEEAIIKNCSRYLIIRTSWLYSEYGSNFVKNIKKLMSNREALGIVYDQVGSPTYAGDLAQVIIEISGSDLKDKYGVYHYSNAGISSWYDLTKEIQSSFQNKCNIQPIETYEYPTPAKRPHYSVFNTKKIASTFNINIPYWKESLEKCLLKP